MMELSPATIAPVILRNVLTSFFFFADKAFGFLAEKSKFVAALRYVVIYLFSSFFAFYLSFSLL
jgi:hypothetical protein